LTDITTEDTAPADDLRSQLETALREQTESTADTTTSTETGETEVQSDRNRDEKGRFAKYEQEATGAQQAAPVVADPTANAAEQTTEETVAPSQGVRPPPGWSPASKAVFDTLPDSVKADIGKREQEVSQGFAKLQRYKDVEHYADHFEGHGFTLGQAFDRYAEADRKLNADFTTGIVELCSHFGKDPLELAQTLSRAFGGQTEQNSQDAGASYQPDLAAYLNQQLGPLRETINSLKSERDAQHRQTISKSVDEFFNDKANLYVDNVADVMIPLLNAGFPLKQAYEQACWQHPEVREQLINERLKSSSEAQAKTVADAKRASRSVSGAPGQGSSPAADADLSIREQLQRGLRASRL